MEIGIFSRTYEVGDLVDTYQRMTAHNIHHTQFNLSNAGLPTLPEELDYDKINEIKKITEQHGVIIDALTGTFNMIDPDLDARKRGCRQFAVQCKIANVLQIPIVSLCTGSKNPESKWKWHDDNIKAASWSDLMHSTEQLLKCAEENNVILGVETEASNIICTPQKARKYMDEFQSDRIKIIMDGANLFSAKQVFYMNEVLTEAFDILGNDIVLAHAKDFSFDGNMAFVAAGKGNLDFERYIELLNKVGYKGALVLHGLSEEQVPESKSFLENILKR
jgi:sugar phosphate isomerase/epimerase